MPTTTVRKKSKTGNEYDLEVCYIGAQMTSSGSWDSPAEYDGEEIVSVHYQGIDVTDFVCEIYSVGDLIN